MVSGFNVTNCTVHIRIMPRQLNSQSFVFKRGQRLPRTIYYLCERNPKLPNMGITYSLLDEKIINQDFGRHVANETCERISPNAETSDTMNLHSKIPPSQTSFDVLIPMPLVMIAVANTKRAESK